MAFGYTYRLEEPRDYAAVEALTREAFWNVYQPGCEEHFIIHSLRGKPSVACELNYVCEDASGQVCGHIFYTHTEVLAEDGTAHPVLSFGPISVHPEHQGKGIGASLIRLTMRKAREMGFPGLVITGNPAYYHRFGFRPASDFGIVFEDGSSFPELMACELQPHVMEQIRGRIQFSTAFSSIDQ